MQPADKIEAQLTNIPLVMTLMTITREAISAWVRPPFQRTVSNSKGLRKAANQIRQDGWLPAVIYLGILDGKTYLVDGHHRIQAFIASGIEKMIVPVIVRYYENGIRGLRDMCQDFVLHSRHIRNPTASDMLRALEGVNDHIKKIRAECPFVGYEKFWKGEDSPILPMAHVVRIVVASRIETLGTGTGNAVDRTETLTGAETHRVISFLNSARQAWGCGIETKYLWSPINLILCFWFFQRMVKGPGIKEKQASLTAAQFHNCLHALGTNKAYLNLLISNRGRQLHIPEVRVPLCKEVMVTFKKRLKGEGTNQYYMPTPQRIED
jgi:hypothetical protein